MKRILLAIVSLCMLGLPAPAIILPVAQDTSSTAKNTLTVAAGASTLLPINAKQQAFLFFNVGGYQGLIPPTSVTGARLRVYFPTAVKPGDISIFATLDGWSESAAGTEPAMATLPIAIIPAAQVVKKKFVVVDVTPIVQAWLSGSLADNGFALQTIAPLAKITMGAKEGSGSGYPAELEIDIATNVLDGSGLVDGSVGNAKLATQLDITKFGNGFVNNTELGHLDGVTSSLQAQINGKANTNHNHDAAAIVSGTFNDNRLSANIARRNENNDFSVAQNINVDGQTFLDGTSTSPGGTWLNLRNTSTNARSFNLISTGSSNGEGPGKLLVRDGSAGAIRMTFDTDGDVGIGTVNPDARLEVAMGSSKSLKVRLDGGIAGLEAVSSAAGDGAAGILRFRHVLEVHPKSDNSAAGKVDVRNANGNATIVLDGGNGKITAQNLPAAKFTQITRDPRNDNDDLQILANTSATLNTLSVNVPSDGILIITATANISPVAEGAVGVFGQAFFRLEETTTGTVKLAEVKADVSKPTAPNAFAASSSVISWSVSTGAGARTFRTIGAAGPNSSAFVDTTTLLVQFVPNSL